MGYDGQLYILAKAQVLPARVWSRRVREPVKSMACTRFAVLFGQATVSVRAVMKASITVGMISGFISLIMDISYVGLQVVLCLLPTNVSDIFASSGIAIEYELVTWTYTDQLA